jgi:hypothetical protein
MRYCIGQENGGHIIGAHSWKDRQWQQLCKVTAREVRNGCRLFVWDGDDLVLFGYPVAQETQLQKKRVDGREAAARRWGKSTGANASPNTIPNGSPTGSPIAIPSGRRNRRSDTESKSKGSVKEEKISAEPIGGEKPPVVVTWLTPVAEIWSEKMGGQFPAGICAKVFAALFATAPPESADYGKILRAFGNYLDLHQGPRAGYIDLPKFASTWAQWVSVPAAMAAGRRHLSAGEQTIDNLHQVAREMGVAK